MELGIVFYGSFCVGIGKLDSIGIQKLSLGKEHPVMMKVDFLNDCFNNYKAALGKHIDIIQ